MASQVELTSTLDPWRASLDEVRANMLTSGEIREPALRVGTINVLLYAPRGTDPPSVHPEDELYVVVRGSAMLLRDDQDTRVALRSGDLASVPAGVRHCFQDMTDNFETWSMLCQVTDGIAGTDSPNRDDGR